MAQQHPSGPGICPLGGHLCKPQPSSPSLCPAGLIPLRCFWQQTWASCWAALLTLRHPEVAGLEGAFAAATQGARSHFWAGKCGFVPAEHARGGEQNLALQAIRSRSFSFCRPLNRIFSLLQDLWGSAPRGARGLQGSAKGLQPRHPEHPLPACPLASPGTAHRLHRGEGGGGTSPEMSAADEGCWKI